MSWFQKLNLQALFRKSEISEEEADLSNLPSKHKGGDCYEVASNYVINNALANGKKELFLVHGKPLGQGAIAGIRFGHAWVEDGNLVIDLSNGRNIRMPKELYYAIGRIENPIRYTSEETRKMLLKHKHYGPWQ